MSAFSTDAVFKIFLACPIHFLIKKLTWNINHLSISVFNMQIIDTSLLVAAYWKMWLYAMQVQEKKDNFNIKRLQIQIYLSVTQLGSWSSGHWIEDSEREVKRKKCTT